jgi:hypothetical protein
MFRGGQFQSSANSASRGRSGSRGRRNNRGGRGRANGGRGDGGHGAGNHDGTPSKEDSAKSLVRSARGPTMKPLIVGTAMTMKMSTNTRLQELLPLDMGSTPTSMQTVVHPITLPVNSRR